MRCIMCVLQLPLSGCAVAPDGAPRAHRASPRAPPARRRAAALLGEMVPGEWSETEDSDAVAADFDSTARCEATAERVAVARPGGDGSYWQVSRAAVERCDGAPIPPVAATTG